MKKYFAKLSLNSKIQEVYSVGENNAPDEKAGIEFLIKQTNYPFWVETFKDRSKRKNYAGIGMTYDEDRDAFIPKKSYTSWVLNESTCQWEPPVPLPGDAGVDDPDNPTEIVEYTWDEDTTSWANRTVISVS
jgi:hypothetical protein